MLFEIWELEKWWSVIVRMLSNEDVGSYKYCEDESELEKFFECVNYI